MCKYVSLVSVLECEEYVEVVFTVREGIAYFQITSRKVMMLVAHRQIKMPSRVSSKKFKVVGRAWDGDQLTKYPCFKSKLTSRYIDEVVKTSHAIRIQITVQCYL